MAAQKDQHSPPPPPWRSKAPTPVQIVHSELTLLYQEQGGPADVSNADRAVLELACREFGFAKTWPSYQLRVQEEFKAKRYWPWVALAALQYKFERDEKKAYDEPTPTEVTDLLLKIASDAKKLCKNLGRLTELSSRLGYSEAPLRKSHLGWLHLYVAQSLLDGPRAEADESKIGSSSIALKQFCQRLIWLEVASGEAAKRSMPKLLKRPTGPTTDKGLGYLVAHAVLIWRHMTGRRASVNRVRPRALSHDDRPDFALFVGNIAKLSCNREPTLGEIETAFNSPYCTEKKLK